MTEPVCDVLVLGSGASGASAASALVRRGLSVTVVDVGFDDPGARDRVPDRPFSELRRGDPRQSSYFLGDNLEGVPRGAVRVGAQLTPPRQFLMRGTGAHLPMESRTFFPMQSLAIGGLAAGWGAASHTYDEAELKRIGIPETRFNEYYEAAAAEVGISGDAADDSSRFCFQGVTGALPPLELDTNAESLLASYGRRRETVNARGLFVGRMPMAVLSRDLGERRANPYFDMDFWGDSRKSIYRPRYLIEALSKFPNFTYRRNLLAARFTETETGVRLDCRDVTTGGPVSLSARRLILCAGAMNTGRLALSSLGLTGVRMPLLASPYTYFPCVNLAMLGREARDRRHSLSQLCGIFRPEDAPDECVNLQFYSYRSLLLFKLVKEMPLPPWAGLLVARLLMNSLTIIGAFHPDAHDSARWYSVGPAGDGAAPLETHYEFTPEHEARLQARERGIARALRSFGCLPFGRLFPGHGSSIHYAGTLPYSRDARAGTTPDDRVIGTKHVFVGDSSSWKFLPGKGLTFTLMANAKRIAERVAASLA